GGFQAGAQIANTEQWSGALAKSDQNAVNGNAPVSIAGGNITGGSSNAKIGRASCRKESASNEAYTSQTQKQTQNAGADSCSQVNVSHVGGAGIRGSGGFQAGAQIANTEQWSGALAKSDQNAVNGNAPVSIAGGNITGGSSNA